MVLSRSLHPLEDLLAKGVLHAVVLLLDTVPLQLFLRQVLLGDRMESHRRPDLTLADVLDDRLQNVVQVVRRVLVRPRVDREVQLVSVMFVTVVELVLDRDLVVHLDSQDDSSLISPAARDVLNGIASAPQDDGWDVEPEHVV